MGVSKFSCIFYLTFFLSAKEKDKIKEIIVLMRKEN